MITPKQARDIAEKSEGKEQADMQRLLFSVESHIMSAARKKEERVTYPFLPGDEKYAQWVAEVLQSHDYQVTVASNKKSLLISWSETAI